MTDFASLIFDLFMWPLEKRKLARVRKALLKDVAGMVLEIGAGTGVNIKYYDSNNIEKLTLLDTDISQRLRERSNLCEFPVELVEASAEKIPFEKNTFDVVVITLVLCSIPDVMRALGEVHRVLKQQGKIVFLEHVLSANEGISKIQHILNGPWRRVAGGCNLNRDTKGLIEKAGFVIKDFEGFWSDIFVCGKAQKEGY